MTSETSEVIDFSCPQAKMCALPPTHLSLFFVLIYDWILTKNALLTGIWSQNRLANAHAMVRQGLWHFQHTLHIAVGVLAM